MVGSIADADLETWGFPRATFFAPVEAAARAGATPPPKPPLFDRYRLQRKALVDAAAQHPARTPSGAS